MLHSWKFAANAVWEKALLIDARHPIDFAAIENWVINQPRNVALEAIFAENDLPSTMFGIRITSLPKTEQAARITQLLSKTAALVTEADFKKVAAEIFPEFTLFSGAMEALNIGIVSQWYSFGPELVWKPGMVMPLSNAELKEKAPRFFEPTRNPAAIEFWYTQPTDHWYKIYVSNLHGDHYLIDADRYDNAISRFSAGKTV